MPGLAVTYEQFRSNPTVRHKVVSDLYAGGTGVSKHNVASFPGATFTERWANAAVKAHSAGGIMVVEPRGDYVTDGLAPIYKPTVWVDGPGGSAATVIQSTGVGDTLNIRMNPFTNTPAGGVSGLTILGNNHPTAVGLHSGNIVGGTLRDLVIRDFTEGGGIWLENSEGWWTERNLFDEVTLDNNKRSLIMSIGGTGHISFGFNNFVGLRMNANAGQTAIEALAGVFFYNSDLFGNCNVSGAGRIIYLHPGAQWHDNRYFVRGEQTLGSGGVGAELDSGGFLRGYGLLNLGMPSINHNPESIGVSFNVVGGVGQTSGGPMDLSSGVVTNWHGSGDDARVIMALPGHYLNPYSGVGFATGPGQESTCFFIFASADSYFSWRRTNFGSAPATGSEIAYMDYGGNLCLAGNLHLVPGAAVPSADGRGHIYIDIDGVFKYKSQSGVVTIVGADTAPAANADTSGATLADLETEVNELKALMRAKGWLAP